jgi:hypothetical protein
MAILCWAAKNSLRGTGRTSAPALNLLGYPTVLLPGYLALRQKVTVDLNLLSYANFLELGYLALV